MLCALRPIYFCAKRGDTDYFGGKRAPYIPFGILVYKRLAEKAETKKETLVSHHMTEAVLDLDY